MIHIPSSYIMACDKEIITMHDDDIFLNSLNSLFQVKR